MMLQVVKLKSEHIEQLLAQDYNAGARPYYSPAYAKDLEDRAFSFALITETGRVVFCGGLAVYWQNRAEAWGLFDGKCKEYFFAIHSAVKSFLDSVPFRRIEASVAIGFEKGHRWIELLGFELEAPVMRAYTPDGSNMALYARVRGAA